MRNSTKVMVLAVAFALCAIGGFAAEANLLPLKDGLPTLTPTPNTKCKLEMVESAARKIFRVTADETAVHLETDQVKPTDDGYMVCEVTARGEKADIPLTLIAIGYQYKAITERHYRLSSDWRKYAAAVKCDRAQEKQNFWARIDFPKGQTMEFSEIKVYPVKSLEELPKDLANTIHGESAYPVPYPINDKAAAGENMLPADGYFGPGLPMHLKSDKPLSPNCTVELKKCQYEKGEFVLEISHAGEPRGRIAFSTAKTPITNNLMVVEVMARSAGVSKGATPRLVVIAVGANYKHISEKTYNLADEWRKYVAVVEIPEDSKKEKNVFGGRVDIPEGVKAQIGRVAVYSMANNTKIAGMADDAATESKKKASSQP